METGIACAAGVLLCLTRFLILSMQWAAFKGCVMT
jgi:hypothetical protein